jgi:hypothetical protein
MLSVIMLSVVMLSVVMLSVVMLSAVMLNVVMLSVVTLSVVILSVVAPPGLVVSARLGKRTSVRCNFIKVVKSIFLQIKNENCHNVEDCISFKIKL